MPITTNSVRTYYDQNTNLFLKFNNSKKAQNIHRSLWKDGIKTLEDALNYSNSLILKEIESLMASNIRFLNWTDSSKRASRCRMKFSVSKNITFLKSE